MIQFVKSRFLLARVVTMTYSGAMPTMTHPASQRPGTRRRDPRRPMARAKVSCHGARMDTPAERGRRYVRAQREQKKWSETQLATAAGVSRSTIQRLEAGRVLREGKEAAIELALGWEIGDIDRIRQGGEPRSVNKAVPEPIDAMNMSGTEVMGHYRRLRDKDGIEVADQWLTDVLELKEQRQRRARDVG